MKYISWVYDAPHKTLYSKTVPYKGNYIFAFDRILYEKLNNREIENIYYEPLAGNTAIFDKLIAYILTEDNLIEDRKGNTAIRNHLAFVGSFYQDQHNYYERLTDLDGLHKHVIDEIVKEHVFCYKEDLINPNLSEETTTAICDAANLYLDGKYNNDML